MVLVVLRPCVNTAHRVLVSRAYPIIYNEACNFCSSFVLSKVSFCLFGFYVIVNRVKRCVSLFQRKCSQVMIIKILIRQNKTLYVNDKDFIMVRST